MSWGEGEAPRKRPAKTALMYATDLLARQDHASAKLREKLLRRGYTEAETETAIERLTAAHYLDDADTCARAFRYLYEESKSSVRQIEQKLLLRGFPRDLVRDCIPADTFDRETRAARRVLATRFRAGADPRKMLRSLAQKGFDLSAARAAVEAFCEAE